MDSEEALSQLDRRTGRIWPENNIPREPQRRAGGRSVRSAPPLPPHCRAAAPTGAAPATASPNSRVVARPAGRVPEAPEEGRRPLGEARRRGRGRRAAAEAHHRSGGRRGAMRCAPGAGGFCTLAGLHGCWVCAAAGLRCSVLRCRPTPRACLPATATPRPGRPQLLPRRAARGPGVRIRMRGPGLAGRVSGRHRHGAGDAAAEAAAAQPGLLPARARAAVHTCAGGRGRVVRLGRAAPSPKA